MDTRILSEYFKRCFLAVDGLWFMMVEKADSFEKALEIDKKVWQILPKIQAGKIKELFEMEGTNEEHLVKALKFKLDTEDFVSELHAEDRQIEITINECPWLALLKKSKREHLAEKIGDAVCSTEYRVFAAEFVGTVDLEVRSRRCSGDRVCSFVLRGF